MTLQRTSWDTRGDLAWKWLCRLAAIMAFGYVLLVKNGDVPLGVFVLIGGFAGLPNVLGLQSLLNKGPDD
jgi:hypothetical protein